MIKLQKILICFCSVSSAIVQLKNSLNMWIISSLSEVILSVRPRIAVSDVAIINLFMRKRYTGPQRMASGTCLSAACITFSFKLGSQDAKILSPDHEIF